MRGLFLILIYLLSFRTGFSQQQLESKLVDQVFHDFNVGKTKHVDTILILLHPIHKIPLKDSNLERFKDKYKSLKKSTYDEFVNNLEKDITLQDIKTLEKPFIVDQTVYKNYSDIFLKHKNVLIIELSNIGYSVEKDQALIYYGSIQRPMSAGGVYLLYEKKKANWKLKKVIGAWAT
jgi:hypothetical protein